MAREFAAIPAGAGFFPPASTPSADVEPFRAPVPDRRTEATALLHLECDDFVECYRLHYPRLVRALELAGASPPVAEDVAQESFARMLSHWRRVRAGTSPAGYAYRTAFRLLQRRIGRRADPTTPVGGPVQPPSSRDATRGGPAEPWPSPAATGPLASPGAGASVPSAEGLVTTRLAVAAALAAMPPRRRVCAVLSLVVGLPTSEVAAALGITEGTVRKHVEEARTDLRQAM